MNIKDISERQPNPTIYILIAGVLALMLMLLVPAPLFANPQAVLHPDPLSLGLRSGEQGTISIRVDGVENLYGLEFHLQFDPSIVEVVPADPAKPLKPGDWLKGGFVAVNKADNTKGTIDYAVTLLNPAPPVSGGGAVATITLRGKKDGTSPLKISKAILATREASEIESELQDGAIGVSVLGQAPQVKVTTNSASQPNSSSGAPSNTNSIATPTLVLAGVAGVGILALFGAIAFLGIILVFRKRR